MLDSNYGGTTVIRWFNDKVCGLGVGGKQILTDETEEEHGSESIEDFMSLFLTNQKSLAIYLASLLPSQNDVDDVMQETSMALWREFPKYQAGTNFRAWAYAIAFNRVRAWRTKRSRDRLVFSDEFVSAIANHLRDNDAQFENRLDGLTECVKKLPTHHRELIDSRYVGQQSIESLCETMGKKSDAVYRMLSRIRRSLHECIDKSVSNIEKA